MVATRTATPGEGAVPHRVEPESYKQADAKREVIGSRQLNRGVDETTARPTRRSANVFLAILSKATVPRRRSGRCLRAATCSSRA